MGEGVFVEELLQRPDRDRLGTRIENAGPFAQPLLRTNPAADLRQVAGRARHFRRFEKTAVRDEGQPDGNAVAERAGLRAGRVGAIDTAAGLLAGGRFIEEAVDFVEVADALCDLAFLRHFSRDVTPVMFRGPRCPRWRCGVRPSRSTFSCHKLRMCADDDLRMIWQSLRISWLLGPARLKER